MDLTEFNLKKDIIKKYYSNLIEIAEKLKNERLLTAVEQFFESLKEDSFNIVIVGEFSRGKSTFINALLGKQILPSSTKPTTIMINRISFGEEPEFNLHFRNSNNIKKITEEEFKDITAKLEPEDYDDESEVNDYNENLKLISSISYADIKYPTEICKQGIEIIDTPGTNDLDQAREEITFNFIPKSDIAILLLSANQILSQSEVNFIKERILVNDIKKVFFVINFKDRLEAKEDEDKVILYAKEHLKEIIDNPRIFMVSARQALNFKKKENGEIFNGIVPETLKETGFDEIEKAITNYLINERGPIKLKKYVHEGSKLADELLNNMINAKLQTVDLEASELEKRLIETTQQGIKDKAVNTINPISICTKPLVQQQFINNSTVLVRIQELGMLMNKEIEHYNQLVNLGLNPYSAISSINIIQKEYKNLTGQVIKVKVASDGDVIKSYEQQLIQQQSINNSTTLARIQELRMLMNKEIENYNQLVNLGLNPYSAISSVNRIQKEYKNIIGQDIKIKITSNEDAIKSYEKQLIQQQSVNNSNTLARIQELRVLMNKEIEYYNQLVNLGLNPYSAISSINKIQKEYKSLTGQGVKFKVINDEDVIKSYDQQLVNQQYINNYIKLARIQNLRVLIDNKIMEYNNQVQFSSNTDINDREINGIQKEYKNLTGKGINLKIVDNDDSIDRDKQLLVQQQSINNANKLARAQELRALMDNKIMEYNNQVQFGFNTSIINGKINDIQKEYVKLTGESIKVEVVNVGDSIDSYEQILLQQQFINNSNKLARIKELRVLMDEKLIKYNNQVQTGLNTYILDGEINNIQKEHQKLIGQGIKVEVVNDIEFISSYDQPLVKQYINNNNEIKPNVSTSVQPKVITAKDVGEMIAKSLINMSAQPKSVNKYYDDTLVEYPTQSIADSNTNGQQIANVEPPAFTWDDDLKTKINEIFKSKTDNISIQPQAPVENLFELFQEFNIGNENNVEIPKIEKNSDEDRILKEKQKNEEHFHNCLNKYKNKIAGSEVELALCYLQGIGTPKDNKKAFCLIVEGAYGKYNNALQLLGDYYYSGYGEIKDVNKANYIYSLARGENPQPINQYKPAQVIDFKKSNNKKEIFHMEGAHLTSVIDSLNSNINGLENSITKLDRDTWWMDRDQRGEWREQNFRNIEKRKKISDYEKIIYRPYYARMDSVFNGEIKTYYIGEEAYIDHSNNSNSIVSVWSEYGQKYRAKNLHDFVINGYQYEIELRRQIEIRNGELIDIFDEYSRGSSVSESRITDPYLIKVLEEKKGEGNITNIIRTIQNNQNDIIDYDFNKSLIVQGCAGSGKTMILLHRLANMKYNMKGLDLSKIKIITPNEQFNLFIDELSKNLKIETIDKMPLALYYIELLGRYQFDKQELYKKLVSTKDRYGNSIKVEENAWRITGPTIEEEKQKICDEVTLSKELIGYIYSDKFEEEIKQNVTRLKNQYGSELHYGELMKRFNETFEKTTLGVINNINNAVKKNYNYILYAKVLFIYEYYGPLIKSDSYLCIDEGQDISVLQYKLLQKVNGGKAIFNVYGDINQQIPSCIGIDDWSSCVKATDAKYFVLNENYRNSDEIIKYYNEKLNFNNTPLGVKTKTVEYIETEELVTHVKLQLLLKNRTAIICNDSELILEEVKKYCAKGNIVNEKAALLTVKQAKGLEFDVVFVIEKNMTKNEKYIAFTRGLSELYIVE